MARKAGKKNTEKSAVTGRKREVLGILIMSLSVLVSLSIVTYNPGDFEILRNRSPLDLLSPDTPDALRIRNALGPLGAWMSHLLVYIMFGYFTMVLAGISLVYGWNIFRHRSLDRLHKKSLYLVLLMVLASTWMGWFHVLFDAVPDSWSGAVGIFFSQFLIQITGSWGSSIILITLLIISIILLFRGNIQGWIDSLKDAINRFREKMAEWKRQRQENAIKRAALRKEKEREAKAKRSETGDDEKPKDEKEPPEIRRIRLEKEEQEELGKRLPRAIVEKPEKEADPIKEDPGITVYRGEGDEEADVDTPVPDSELAGLRKTNYVFPGFDLLDAPPNEGNEIDMEEINHNKDIIVDKLRRHGIEILNIEAIVGPTVTLYELEPAPDVKISRIEGYANDLKMAMATHGLRIIAPIPGKSAVGIEVPNRKRETVFIKQVIKTKRFIDSDMTLPVAFGKTIENEVFMVDLTKLPHLLIAGATGAGKSVGINTVITCLLYKCRPEDLKFVMVDPKKIELALYRHIQNHFLATLEDLDEPIITDTARVQEALNSVCKEMDDRYELLKMAGVRDIKSYNAKYKSGALEDELGHRHLPYIVVIIDEMADLMITAGKGIEEPIARIAQLARAVGIHLVVATQRPSVNVITGTIKANFPARIAYRVASKVDSRTILDTIGADQLVGRGDMLFTGGSGMVRVQNAFVSTEEVERINAFIGRQPGYTKPFYLPKMVDESASGPGTFNKADRDELFDEAAKLVVMHQQGSVSLIQRKLRLGYNRAGRIIDQLFHAGIVGPYQGSTAREVLVQDEFELQEILDELNAP